jgi:hypothetical protein
MADNWIQTNHGGALVGPLIASFLSFPYMLWLTSASRHKVVFVHGIGLFSSIHITITPHVDAPIRLLH